MLEVPSAFEKQINSSKLEQISKNINDKFGEVVLTFQQDSPLSPGAIGIYALNVCLFCTTVLLMAYS